MHETIEGEVILIDLTTGSYYSLRDAGALIWQAVLRGVDEEGIGDILQRRYTGSREELQSGVRGLLDQLAAEDLIEPAESSAEPGTGIGALPEVSADRPPFRAPLLEKFTDMQDLILLDPVHEVDSRGWPHAASAQTEIDAA